MIHSAFTSENLNNRNASTIFTLPNATSSFSLYQPSAPPSAGLPDSPNFSEDEDEEDEEDKEDVEAVEEGEETNRQEESDGPPPPVSRDIFQLRYEALGASLTGSSEPPRVLAADVDVVNPDWKRQDLEYTSLGFGKKTASFVCKSFSFRC